MSTSAMERVNASQNNEEQEPDRVSPAEMQPYFGENVQVLGVEALLRIDYTGYASHSKSVGGALVVRCTVSQEGSVGTRAITIDDSHRLPDEALIARLGAQANKARNRGMYIHNYIPTPKIES